MEGWWGLYLFYPVSDDVAEVFVAFIVVGGGPA